MCSVATGQLANPKIGRSILAGLPEDHPQAALGQKLPKLCTALPQVFKFNPI